MELDEPRIITWNELDGLSFSVYGTLYILITDLLLYPADLITTRLQADKVNIDTKFPVYKSKRNQYNEAYHECLQERRNQRYKSA